MRAFDDAIDKMFWPEKRAGAASIVRTSAKSWLVIPAVYLPSAVEGVVGRIARPFTAMPWLLPALVLIGGIALIVIGRRSKRFVRFSLLLLGTFALLLGVILVPVNFFIAGKLGDLKVGPFPKGMPLNLMASINPEAPHRDVLSAVWKMHKATGRIAKENLSDEEATRVFEAEAAPALLKVSKSPDWVDDRGHYFQVPLSDDDKRALKEYLKTL